MHKSAMVRMKWFVDHYIDKNKECKVLDIGSYNVNGAYNQLFRDTKAHYTGLDLSDGPNVDIVPKDPYSWTEIQDESFDYVISGNAFEHIEYPWLTIKEAYRILKKDGFACILAPFSIPEHKYPTDCYRYYADGFKALAKWGGFKIVDVTVGGISNDPLYKEMLSSEENYDDTMMIICKTDDESKLTNLPRLSGCKFTHKWSEI